MSKEDLRRHLERAFAAGEETANGVNPIKRVPPFTLRELKFAANLKPDAVLDEVDADASEENEDDVDVP